MTELIANISGAGQMNVARPHFPREIVLENVSEQFVKQVLADTRFAWYVDHFTEDAQMFNVRYFSEDPLISWTNENLGHRDPGDLKNTMWAPDDVAEWFATAGPEDQVSYEHRIKFHSGGCEYHLHLAPYKVLLGAENRWDAYVRDGIRGAIGSLVAGFDRLDAVAVYRV